MAASCTTVRLAPGTVGDAEEPTHAQTHHRPVRGVGWVLRWAAALATLGLAAVVLLDFAYCLAAERTLARAAAAGIREAACDRATRQSVERSVRRQLPERFEFARNAKISFRCNDTLVQGAIRPREGDRLAVTVSAPAEVALPRWLSVLTPWRRHATITVRIERA